MRKTFATSIDETIQADFKQACDEYGVKMNQVLEAFMNQFCAGEFEIRVSRFGTRLELDSEGKKE